MMRLDFLLPDDDPPEMRFAEILSSLSYALDLTSGQPMGHAQRACLIGMRIGKEIGLSEADRTSLYFALLMKDAGCSSNAARMFEIFGGDDIEAKYASKIVDWSNVIEAVKYAAAQTLPDGSLLARARRVLSIAVNPAETTNALMHSRCSRGAQIALALGLGHDAAECIRCLDEHWDGQGAPTNLKGAAIPLLARIACLAQTLEVFARTFGLGAAYEMARTRSRRWFDPELVGIAHSFRQDDRFWNAVRESSSEALVRLDVQAAVEKTTESRLDSICDAFAQIVDAKSQFTGEHSSRVCAYAVEIAQGLGFTGARLTTLRRAALLHDIGKLAVPNTILDKNGKPTEEEWVCIRRHPYHTEQILKQIAGFERLTEIASAHHERLDGKGYFRGLAAEQMDLDMRVLAVADVYDALSAKRPYRDALPPEQVFAILDKESLDKDCVDILKQRDCPAPPCVSPLKTFSQVRPAHIADEVACQELPVLLVLPIGDNGMAHKTQRCNRAQVVARSLDLSHAELPRALSIRPECPACERIEIVGVGVDVLNLRTGQTQTYGQSLS